MFKKSGFYSICLLDTSEQVVYLCPQFSEQFSVPSGIIGMNFLTILREAGFDLTENFISELMHSSQQALLHNYRVTWSAEVYSAGYIVKAEVTDLSCTTPEMLADMIDNMPCNIYWMDKECRMMGANKKVLEMCGGMPLSEYKGLDYSTLARKVGWSESLLLKFESDDKTVLRTGSALVNVEDPPIPLADGKQLYLLTNRIPLRDRDGNIVGVAGISLDISDLKEAQSKTEEALLFAKEVALLFVKEAERRRKQFLSNQEHDINTALTGIIYAGMVFQNMDGTEDPADIKASADMIVKSSKRLQAYNRSLLKDLAWLNDKGKVIERRTEIRKTLKKLYEINCLAAKARASTLAFDNIGEEIPQYIMIDDVALFQCLQDMVTNAINFTTNGTITLNIKLPQMHSGSCPVIAFHVKDTGRGISLKHQRYIFEDYYKALPSNQPEGASGLHADEDKGRGLGLTISLKKAQAMGGELHLEWSEEGVGSEFVLTVPLKPTLNQGQQ